MIIKAQALAQLPLFARLGDGDLQEIAPHIRERAFSSGQTIVLEGEPCQAVYFVVRGVVRSYRLSREGREQVLAYLGPGEFFNLVSVLDGEPTMVSVEGLTEGMLYAVSSEHFRRIVREYHEAALAVTERLAAEVRRLSDMVEDLALHTVRVRLARFLLTQAEHPQHPSFQWTQAEIAAHIGTVREMVGRTLRTFAADGLIRQEQGRIIVKDREKLEQEAAGV
jgi:CRP/FNR family cyclic AMP-dependent transcriptional regulator